LRKESLNGPSNQDCDVVGNRPQLLGLGGFDRELKLQSNSPLELFFLGREGGKKIPFPLPENL
jgi:hypothetical protein